MGESDGRSGGRREEKERKKNKKKKVFFSFFSFFSSTQNRGCDPQKTEHTNSRSFVFFFRLAVGLWRETEGRENPKKSLSFLNFFFQFLFIFFTLFFPTSFLLSSKAKSRAFIQKQRAGLVSSLAVSTSHPVSVTTSVCSNCADFSPSVVTEVHPSGHVTSLHPPALIIGSIVKTWPDFIIPTALFPA